MRKLVEGTPEEKISQPSCYYCNEPAMYFDTIRKIGVIRIIRIIDGEEKEVEVCRMHYDLEVNKPLEKKS